MWCSLLASAGLCLVPKTYGRSKRRKIVVFGASIYRVSAGGPWPLLTLDCEILHFPVYFVVEKCFNVNFESAK